MRLAGRTCFEIRARRRREYYQPPRNQGLLRPNHYVIVLHMKINRSVLWPVVFLVVLAPMFSWSCQLDIQMEPGAPPTVGAIGIIIVTITQTHNPCLLAIDKTKVKATGFVIMGATPWKESKPQVFTRKFKVKFQESGEALFAVDRTCPREVSKKEFRFQIAP